MKHAWEIGWGCWLVALVIAAFGGDSFYALAACAWALALWIGSAFWNRA